VLDRDKLKNMYQLNFAMVQHHGYSLTEIEGMMPWEREIYVGMLANHVKERNEKLKEQAQKRRNR